VGGDLDRVQVGPKHRQCAADVGAGAIDQPPPRWLQIDRHLDE
jgi:hypothetical protein